MSRLTHQALSLRDLSVAASAGNHNPALAPFPECMFAAYAWRLVTIPMAAESTSSGEHTRTNDRMIGPRRSFDGPCFAGTSEAKGQA
jgi:hypothetical protein